MPVQEQSNSDPFNSMGLIEKQGTNLVMKDKETVINCDTSIETEQSIPVDFNKDQGNESQDKNCNYEQSIDNNNMSNEFIHTNISEKKEAIANNTIDDGTEETKISWPPGYTDGHSGGIVSIWNPYIFDKHTIISNPNVLIIEGRWLDVKLDIYMVNVYAPQDEEGKQHIWRYITEFMSSNPGHYIIFEDFNSVRNSSERFGSIFSTTNAFYFNDFIANGNLIYHSWFQGDGFDKVVSDFWSNCHYRRSSSALINFKNKLQGLKGVIKVWVNTRRSRTEVINSLGEELRNLNLNIDMRKLIHGGDKRLKLVNEIHKLEREQKDDLIQKSRIKWCTNGDDNSKFFHGTINKKRKQLSVRGIKLNGLWVEDPMAMVSQHQLEILESEVSLEEIKDVVWDCGSNKLPGELPIGCNASFITLIPKIESPIVVNDFRPISLIGISYKIIAKIISCRIALIIDDIVDLEEEKAMIFKVDIAKAYDTISWDYLLSVIKFMGFDNKCVRWIKACLESARSSVLVNGSPTMEFQLQRGLRQGDPLAPFLFILAMEGFHIAMEDAIEAKKFVGINIGDICLSHLIYADDVIVLGEWSKCNMDLVLASKDRGGLDFGSLHSLNLALLYKWRWRFYNHPDALWTKIIKNLYPFTNEAQGWDQKWRRLLRGGVEDDQYHRICDIIKHVTIIQTKDSWRWSCDTMDSFLVNGLRKYLDCLTIPRHYLETSNGLESIYHVMSECNIAIKVWESIVKWLNLNLPFQLPPIELLDFVNNEGNLNKAKDIIFTIIYTAWWEIWRFRNDVIFRTGKKRDVDIVDSIIHFSYLCYSEDDRTFTSQAWNRLFKIHERVVREYVMEFLSSFTFRDHIVDLDNVDTMVFELGGVKRSMTMRPFILALGWYTPEEMSNVLFEPFHESCLETGPTTRTPLSRHSGKEKVTMDDLLLLHIMDGGVRVDVPWHVAKFFTNKAKGYKKKSPIVGAHLIGRIARYNGLGYGELVDDIPDNDEDKGAADAGNDDEGGVRRRPNMSFTNMLRAMDKRLGEIETDISKLGCDVDDLTYVVSGMFEQYDQFYEEFGQMRMDTTVYSTAPSQSLSPNPLLFGYADAGPSTSQNQGNDMNEE
ncbi:RNA-directed DNA polymerase, eukaryota [Tanacetum coccineum]